MASVLSPQSRIRQVNRLLARNERVVNEVRRHWAQGFWVGVLVFSSLIITLILDMLIPLSSVVHTLLWVSFWALVGFAAWRYIEWSMHWFVITDRRFMLAYGVVNRQVGMMPLPKVTDMRYERTFWGRLLGYGKFVLESAGQDQALSTINYLPNPDDLYVQVCDLLFGRQDTSDGT
ncbi:MAG TPA: PH domain-containing protein [Actinomycetes bacterium]|nr:PH domain-containing protein [Actinomycetes bacterium]